MQPMRRVVLAVMTVPAVYVLFPVQCQHLFHSVSAVFSPTNAACLVVATTGVLFFPRLMRPLQSLAELLSKLHTQQKLERMSTDNPAFYALAALKVRKDAAYGGFLGTVVVLFVALRLLAWLAAANDDMPPTETVLNDNTNQGLLSVE